MGGRCEKGWADEATPCEDGDRCTEGEECNGLGECVGTPVDSDDGDVCTDDRCEEGEGCVHDWNEAPCDDRNACTIEDICGGGLCRGTPVQCDSPPANECSPDGTRMISYSSHGLCADGNCVYAQQVVLCANGCVGGVCQGEDPCSVLDCTQAPRCLKSPGVCVGGRCVYEYDDGASCEEDDPCTVGEECRQGVCSGYPVVCNQPPPDQCADGKHLKDWSVNGWCDQGTGQCPYPYTMVECPGGCVDGPCVEGLGLWQSDLTPGGPWVMTGHTYGLSCVMESWVMGARTSSATYTLEAGFEP